MPLEANSTGCQARPVAFSTMTEQRVWRGVDPDLFRFATTERADPNVAVMTAFDRASTLDPALNIDRVREALLGVGWDIPVEDDVLHRCLESFVGWGLLDVTQDHGAQYATPEEFERKNRQWSLTRRGEAAIGGLLQALDSLRHAVGLQPAVLDASPLPSRIPWRPCFGNPGHRVNDRAHTGSAAPVAAAGAGARPGDLCFREPLPGRGCRPERLGRRSDHLQLRTPDGGSRQPDQAAHRRCCHRLPARRHRPVGLSITTG